MTRLSDALKRAQETAAAPPIASEEALPPPTTWKFAPVETMHVPDEPSGAPLTTTPAAVAEPAPEDFEVEAPAFMPPAATAPVTPPSTARRPSAPALAAPAPHPAIRVGDADRSKLIVGDAVDAAMVEQYRHLAAVMHHAQKASGVRSVMVTSALPAEGKTLTATNLALTLSESYQRRVLLIDADLRRPRMMEMFALDGGEGLTDSLAQPRDGRLPVHQV